MIKDLKQSTVTRIELARSVCIIGAGTAGILLARQLRRFGVAVVLLEAGDRVSRRPDEVRQHCRQSGIRYRGADLGRSFGLGGTSVLWGGQMIPLTTGDMQARPEVGIGAWPISSADLSGYLQTVRQTLGLEWFADAEQALLARRFPTLSRFGADFQLRLSQWLPFRRRNFAKAFADSLEADPGLEVWLNASVVRQAVATDGSGRISEVEARSENGRQLVVRPTILAVCAGALESTRLMLELDESSQGLLGGSGAPLGRYFSDHLSVTCGRFGCRDWQRYNLETAPIFVKGVMRTPRLELSAGAQQRLGITSAFAHFTFFTRGDTGFDVVRNVLRKRQGENQAFGLSLWRFGRVVGDVSAMAFWRGFHRRLWIPRQADLLLQIDTEQVPNWNSRLCLADDRDDWGRKRLQIQWQIGSEDVRVIRTVAERTIQAWGASSLAESADLRLALPACLDDFESLYDVYHPTGTLRMGNRAADSIVDADLRVWRVDNCYISSTAVFPSAGSANPGLTHLALTARLAEHIARSLR